MKKKSVLAQLRDWLNDLPIEDPIQRRMASLFQSVLIGLIVVVLLATLVKRIIEYHGGRIWVESNISEGSTYYFALPPLGQPPSDFVL